MEDFIFLILIIGVLILAVFYIRKRKKNQSKPPKTYLGCTLTLIIFLIIFTIFVIFGVKMMEDTYDRAEKAEHKISFDKIMVFFNSSNDYQNLSDTKKKTMAVKLFLLNGCRGGDETLKKLIHYEQNNLYDACIIVQKNNIIGKFTESGDNLKRFHMQVLKTDFKGAVKLYDWYITE